MARCLRTQGEDPPVSLGRRGWAGMWGDRVSLSEKSGATNLVAPTNAHPPPACLWRLWSKLNVKGLGEVSGESP